MKLIINGKPTELDREMSIAELLHIKGVDQAFVAVEHNLVWTKREDWSSTCLHENDRLEIVRVIAGG
ncbi:MAG: sulfur carrier protein ThiS [Chloroflexota bacterium]